MRADFQLLCRRNFSFLKRQDDRKKIGLLKYWLMRIKVKDKISDDAILYSLHLIDEKAFTFYFLFPCFRFFPAANHTMAKVLGRYLG